ncbi:lytic polysaccharide monooxygenase [Daldinia vernicosa]|uniref:lytic polysaccharide monooxygenase n=1 Tax=Daldinia vernicosa TaxID=114800 RepID=UPI0020076C91|nr:lytic polysaccharide monooxygenase [Daldinia vernicosa]KAI0844749.1 lytic polysaccharide monooxygenase [Daldinia vernicosa]
MPSALRSSLLAAIAGAVSVSAHGHVTTVTIDGKSYTGFDPTSAPYATQPDSITWSNGATDNGFVLSSALQDPDIICHLDATNAALSAPVTAGSNVSITWNQWPDSHKGPVIDYLADCGGNCSSVDKTTLKWFKIAEAGQLTLGAGSGTTGKWADDLIIEDSLTWQVTIPSALKSGNYVLRHEIIALHEGGTEGKAQMYPQCINLQVSGSGTQSPDGVVGTQLYTSTDPGILHNIYNDEKLTSVSDYVIPGPALVKFDGSSSSNGGASSSSAASAQPTTTAPTATSAATSAATSSIATSSASSTSTAAANTQPAASSPAASSTPKKTCSSKRHARRHARQLKSL